MTNHESRRVQIPLLLAGVALTLSSLPLAGEGRTHRFEPSRYYNTFSFAHEPVLRIRPGDRVVTRTIDARGGNHTGARVAKGPNPQTGPFYVEGADARQGDGEVVGNALEISMDVEFSVDLIKNKKIAWPRLETDDAIMVLGSARPLLQALQHATTELQRWLMKEYGFDERDASLLMGHAMEYEIANVVDPHFTVVAKLRKSFLSR